MLLLPTTVAHGITDLVVCPRKTLISYAIINPIVLQMDVDQQAMLLIASSIYHMRKDVPGGLLTSSCMHNLWLVYPDFAVFFLNYIHTPRHFMRSLKTQPIPKICLVATMSLISLGVMIYNVEPLMSNTYGILWWSAPVVSHIFVNELFVDE
jgi:hypothetical protein